MRTGTISISRRSKLGPSIDHLAIVCFLIGGAFVIKQSSSNQEVAELVTNKQWPSDQLTALTYYVYYKHCQDNKEMASFYLYIHRNITEFTSDDNIISMVKYSHHKQFTFTVMGSPGGLETSEY